MFDDNPPRRPRPAVHGSPQLTWICLAIVCALPIATASGGTTIHVRDFGAVPDGQTESGNAIRAAIAAAIAANAETPQESVEVLLDPGTYLVRPENPRNYCFPINRAQRLTVRGAGQDTKIVICDPTAGGFHFGVGHQVALRDLVVDYDPVPFCQGIVQAVDVEQGTFDLEVQSDYPTPDQDNFATAHDPYGKWGMIIDPATRRIRSGTPDHYMTPRWEHRVGRVWRFFTAAEHYRRNLVHMHVGDAYVHLARGYGSAVAAQGCEDVRVENIIVHASPGLAIGLVGNRGEILVRQLQVRFAPDTDRLITTDADGVHCQQNRSGPIIEDCYFEGMADDAINIYAPPNILREIRSPTQWLVSPGCIVLPGDRLQVLDPLTGRIRGETRVVGGKIEQRAFLLDLSQPVQDAVAGTDHRSADTLYNLDACGAGFQIRRNHMRGNRRYGCLLRAGNGVVEYNSFEDTTGAGVVVTNEPDWPEGPMPWGITIRSNRFLRGGTCLGYADTQHGAALAVRATRLGHALAEAESIRGVVIEDNTFQDREGTALFLGGTTDVVVRGNRIEAAPEAIRTRPGPAMLIDRASLIRLNDNVVDDPRESTTAAIEIGSHVAPGEQGVSNAELHVQLSPGSPPLLDHRPQP